MNKASEKRIKPPDKIIVDAVRSLNGEITTNMRMVALKYRDDVVLFKFYMAKNPTDDEYENAEIVAVNFDSLQPTKLKKLDLKFEVTSEPLGKLDPLDFILFRRCED